MTVTLTHRTGQQVVKENVVKYTQDENYITLYFDPTLHTTLRYVKLPVRAYGGEVYKVSKIEV